MVKRQVEISSYTRVKNNQIENVKKHKRQVDVGPRLNKNELKNIKTGKAKRLTTREFLTGFKDKSKAKDNSLKSFKTGNKQKGILGFAGVNEKAMEKGFKPKDQVKNKKLDDFTKK